MMNAQFFGGSDVINIIMFLLFFVSFFFMQRLAVMQILHKLDQKAREYEIIAAKSKRMLLNRLPNKSSRTIKESLNRFSNFFVIEPVGMDPAGIVRKYEHIIDASEDRFQYFIDNVAPHKDSEEKANLMMGVKGVIGVTQVAKVVRHYVEMVRKTRNFQIAMLLQMQIPFIERVIKSQYHGTEAFLKGQPVGDSIGPFMAASLLDKEGKELDRDVLVSERKYKGRTLYVMKAKGPGGRLGKLGRATEKIMSKNKIAKIITIDAGMKLEGEKTGSVAEGVGIAIGGVGVEKSQIEDLAVKYRIPMDSVVVKQGAEEAIEPMRQSILDAEEDVIAALDSSLDRSPKGAKIIVIGVGNTIGVGNKRSDLKSTRDMVKKIEQEAKRKEKEAKDKKSWKNFFFKSKNEDEKHDDEW